MMKNATHKALVKEKIALEDARSNWDIQRRLEIAFRSRVEASGGEPNAIHEIAMLAFEIRFMFSYAIDDSDKFFANCKLTKTNVEVETLA